MVMIGIDPHKGSHTAVALDDRELELGALKVRAGRRQREQLLEWAAPFDARIWAIESANGLGYLLAQQLLAAGERVLDVPATLASRVRVLSTGRSNKNDPNDARSVAVAALRAPSMTEVRCEDHMTVLRLLAKRHIDLGRWRNKVCCRLHAHVAELVAGGISKEIVVAQASELLAGLRPAGVAAVERHRQALELVDDLTRIDDQLRVSRRRIDAGVAASGTTLTEVFGVGPVIAAILIGYTGDPLRFATHHHYAAYNGTAPVEFSSAGRTIHRLSLRGNRQFSERHGVLDNSAEALKSGTFDENNTVARSLSEAGYRTGLFGKYLNQGSTARIPQPSGWDTSRQLVNDEDATSYNEVGYTICDGARTLKPPESQTAYLQAQAITFVSGPEPWFCYFAPTAPHKPYETPPDDVHWQIVDEVDVSDKPSWVSSRPALSDENKMVLQDIIRAQVGEIRALDRVISAVLSHVDPAKTVCYFTSDNGIHYGEHRYFGDSTKNTAYDASMRVPLVVRGHGFRPGRDANPVTHQDITSTILAIASAAPRIAQDGTDLRSTSPDRKLLHEVGDATPTGDHPAGNGMSDATRKLWRFANQSDPNSFEAYDLDTDPNELANWAYDPGRLSERIALEAGLDSPHMNAITSRVSTGGWLQRPTLTQPIHAR